MTSINQSINQSRRWWSKKDSQIIYLSSSSPDDDDNDWIFSPPSVTYLHWIFGGLRLGQSKAKQRKKTDENHQSNYPVLLSTILLLEDTLSSYIYCTSFPHLTPIRLRHCFCLFLSAFNTADVQEMMKFLSTILMVTSASLIIMSKVEVSALAPPQPAPTTRNGFFKKCLVGTVATTAVMTFSNNPTSTKANAASSFDPQTFNHQYTDPKHPNCKRIVVVKRDGEAAISGTDGTPGCPDDGSGTVWRLVGEVEGSNILVDFSAKVWGVYPFYFVDLLRSCVVL